MHSLVSIIMGYLDDYMAGRLYGGLHESYAEERLKVIPPSPEWVS